DAERAVQRALRDSSARMGAAKTHAASHAGLWHTSSRDLEQCPGRSPGRRGLAMEEPERDALGFVRESPLRTSRYLVGNLDLVALTGLSCHTSGYESRS